MKPSVDPIIQQQSRRDTREAMRSRPAPDSPTAEERAKASGYVQGALKIALSELSGEHWDIPADPAEFHHWLSEPAADAADQARKVEVMALVVGATRNALSALPAAAQLVAHVGQADAAAQTDQAERVEYLVGQIEQAGVKRSELQGAPAAELGHVVANAEPFGRQATEDGARLWAAHRFPDRVVNDNDALDEALLASDRLRGALPGPYDHLSDEQLNQALDGKAASVPTDSADDEPTLEDDDATFDAKLLRRGR